MKCLICGKEHNNKKYCSENCQYEAYKVKKVDRIKVECLNCHQEFETISTKVKKYCSRKCVDEHKKITYLREKNPMFNFKVSDETKLKHSILAKKMWENEDIANKIKKGIKEYNDKHDHPSGWSKESREKRINTYIEKYGVSHNWKCEKIRENINKTCLEKYGKTSYEIMIEALHKTNVTSIEKIFEDFLLKNHILYEKQYRIYFKNEQGKLKFRSYDFLLKEKNILIEIDGDYWHGNPIFFKKLNETQNNNKKNDFFKNELAKIKNMILIRFWETQINNNEFEEEMKEIIYGKD